MRRVDAGSATVWVLALCVLFLTVATAVTLRTAAVLARHRAETAADLAALAAAGSIGLDSDPCSAARRIATRNSAVIDSCQVLLDPSGRSGTVRVRVDTAVRLPLVGDRSVTAVARAGRMPPAQQPSA